MSGEGKGRGEGNGVNLDDRESEQSFLIQFKLFQKGNKNFRISVEISHHFTEGKRPIKFFGQSMAKNSPTRLSKLTFEKKKATSRLPSNISDMICKR